MRAACTACAEEGAGVHGHVWSVRECTVVDKGTAWVDEDMGMRGHVRVCATMEGQGQGKASDE